MTSQSPKFQRYSRPWMRPTCESFLAGNGQKPTRGCGYVASNEKPFRKAILGEKMAGATGLEPATSGVTGRHSNQLSYAPASSAQKAAREGGRCRAPTP